MMKCTANVDVSPDRFTCFSLLARIVQSSHQTDTVYTASVRSDVAQCLIANVAL